MEFIETLFENIYNNNNNNNIEQNIIIKNNMIYLNFIAKNSTKIIDNETYNNFINLNSDIFDNISFDTYKNINKLYLTTYNNKNNHIDLLNYYLKSKKIIKYCHRPIIIEEQNIKLIFNELIHYNINYNTDLILNLYSRVGSFMQYLIKNKTITNLIGFDTDYTFNCINNLNLEILSMNNKYSIRTANILNDNLNIKNAKLILCDIPEDIKNIIHAQCSNNIKQLKIRGTKSEPLLIQLITTLLAKDGIAVVIVADSFLYNDSTQHVETRKYLMTKFNIKKIINLPDMKKSIIFFTNTGPTTNIILTNLENNLELTIDNINIKTYSFYYYHYEILTIKNKIIDQKNNLNFYINILPISTIENEALYISKYNQLTICKLSEIKSYDYVIVSKDETLLKQYFLNHFLKNILEKNINNLVKGKIRQYDINLILNLNLNIPSVQIQDMIINHIKNNNNLKKTYEDMIENIIQLKKSYIKEIIDNNNKIQLKEICFIDQKSTEINTIQIHRNSNLVGNVNLTINHNDSSTNFYYITIINKDYNNKVLYHVLKYYEDQLAELSNLNTVNQLAKNKLEKISIPFVSDELNNKMLLCDKFDNEIKILETNLNLIDSNLINFFCCN